MANMAIAAILMPLPSNLNDIACYVLGLVFYGLF